MSVRVQALAAACVLSGVLGCTPTTHRRPSVIGAESGDPRAQLSLGMLYAYGRGVPQDDAQAAAWFRKAADQGLAAAQRRLGAMYVLGQGVPQDDVEAHRWLNLAASRVSGAKQAEYAKLRDDLAQRMSAEQIAAAHQPARAWAEQKKP